MVTVTRLGIRGDGGAAILADETPGILGEIEAKTGLGYGGPLSLVLCTDLDSFGSYAATLPGGHSDALGFFAPPEIIPGSAGVPSIALNLELIGESGARVREVYKHELAHAVLHANILLRMRPLWFEEGVAQWVSKTPFESVMRGLGYAGGGGSDPRSLGQVSEWMRTPDLMGDAYAHGLAAVQLMESMNGEGSVRKLLLALAAESRNGSTARLEEVYRSTFERSFDAFQSRFVEQRRRTDWGRWLGFVGANLWALLMLLGGVLIGIGVWRKKKREAAMVESWERIDAEFPSAYMSSQGEAGEDAAEQAIAEHQRLYSGDDDEEDEGFAIEEDDDEFDDPDAGDDGDGPEAPVRR